MQRLKLRIEERGEKLSAAYAPPKWSETAGKVSKAEELICRNIGFQTKCGKSESTLFTKFCMKKWY